MKKILFLLTFLITIITFTFSQDRNIARGAEPGELYLTAGWYDIYDPTCMYDDTIRSAIYRLTENGKKLTIQYDVDAFANPADTVMPYSILADATPGVIYAKNYYANNGFLTSLWVSFDYGKNWIFREENNGQQHYLSSNFDGILYRTGSDWWDGTFKSNDYGANFTMVDSMSVYANEPGIDTAEFFTNTISYPSYSRELWHTYDVYHTTTIIPVDDQYVNGDLWGCTSHICRGGLKNEVYLGSLFSSDKRYRVSFSADTGHTFRHVYVSDEVYSAYSDSYPTFITDREPGVFYIIKFCIINDLNPCGWHRKICIEYYRDYGETLVATYCHDLTKGYGKSCKQANNLAAEKCSNNCVLLSWSEPESSLPVEEYDIYRNDKLQSVTTDTTYMDENLPVGNYEYYVVAHYKMGCVADSSNHVKESVGLEVTEVKKLEEVRVYPNPTDGELKVKSEELRVKNVAVFDVYGRMIEIPHFVRNDVIPNETQRSKESQIINIVHLPSGIYFIKITTEEGIIVRKIVKQ